MPDCFRGIDISYHDNNSYGWLDGNDYFSSAGRGQEFVVQTEASGDMQRWLLDVLSA